MPSTATAGVEPNQEKTARTERSLLWCSIHLTKKVFPVLAVGCASDRMQAHGSAKAHSVRKKPHSQLLFGVRGAGPYKIGRNGFQAPPAFEIQEAVWELLCPRLHSCRMPRAEVQDLYANNCGRHETAVYWIPSSRKLCTMVLAAPLNPLWKTKRPFIVTDCTGLFKSMERLCSGSARSPLSLSRLRQT